MINDAAMMVVEVGTLRLTELSVQLNIGPKLNLGSKVFSDTQLLL